MSSTNRSDARDKHISDYYVTPISSISEFIRSWINDSNFVFENALILDPCAGGDEQHEMSYPKVIIEEFGGKVRTTDIREDSLAECKEDFLAKEFKKEYDLVITNPPFNKAREIIEKALEITKDGGYVVMLLRLNFFGTKARKDFWDNQMPINAYVHHKRLSFTEDKKTDSIEYMHAVWKKGFFPEYTKIKVI